MKRKLFFSAAIYLCYLCAISAQDNIKRDTISYINGDCLRTEDFSQQAVSFRLQDDTIYIEGRIAANYCGEHYLTYEQWEDSIAIKVYDKYVNDVPCIVNCLYPAEAKIGDCSGKYYKVNIQNHIVGEYQKNAVLKNNYKPTLVGDTIRWSFLENSTIDAPLRHIDVVAYGDTVIDNIHYKHLGIHRTNLFNNYWNTEHYSIDKVNALWQDYSSKEPFEKWNYCIRESADNTKLYIYDIEAEKEYLLSDLSLNDGDKLIVEGIDEVTAVKVGINDGMKYIIFDSDFDLRIVESLGADSWLFFPFIYSGVSFLNCFKNDVSFFSKINDYLPGHSIPCGCDEPFWAKTETVQKKDFRTEIDNSILKISFVNEQDGAVYIYNMNGTVMQESKVNSSEIQIPIVDFQPGMYMLKVMTKSHPNMEIEKIIIP